jgi:hypothetical protein
MEAMAKSLGENIGQVLGEVLVMTVLGLLVALPFLLLAGALSLLREELELAGEQSDQLLKLRAELMDDLKRVLSDPDTRSLATLRDALVELDPKYRKKIRALLNDRQARRFDELVFQLQGGKTLAVPEIALHLQLSDDQQTKITRIVKIDPRDLETSRKLFELTAAWAERLQREKDALAVLTDSQRREFEKMKGEPSQLLTLKTVLGVARTILEPPPEEE